MYTSTMLATVVALTSIASAAPAPRDTYYGVSVNVITSSGLDPNKVSEPAPVEINKLTVLGGSDGKGVSASELILDPNIASGGIDINEVQCRAYKDVTGVQPGSAPFNATSPAMLTTNLVTVSSISCYIITETEVSQAR